MGHRWGIRAKTSIELEEERFKQTEQEINEIFSVSAKVNDP
ncbi:hypothetical protein XIS1_300009 [Xenorhabdus innexi]|uniref:Uncharacterized protein n=1 Tax=Xenorhabdus innexi TaxID=290109 RepID=A0A1N6MXG7_9GAMM|nr:hypothetical protein XIS1_300009 [Xenorhabdus innexi]